MHVLQPNYIQESIVLMFAILAKSFQFVSGLECEIGHNYFRSTSLIKQNKKMRKKRNEKSRKRKLNSLLNRKINDFYIENATTNAYVIYINCIYYCRSFTYLRN